MEKKELIGRKVKGFAFEKIGDLDYNDKMNNYIGKEGEICYYDIELKSYKVQFDDDHWYYPASLIEQHLVPENYKKTDMELLDKFALVALPSVIDRMSIYASSEDVSKTCYDIAKSMLDERGKYE